MVDLLYEDAGAVVARERNLGFYLLRDRPVPEHFEALADLHRHILSAHPEGAGLLTVVTSTHWMPAFSDELRRAARHLVETTEHGSLGSAFVLGGHGLLSSAIRGFVGTLFLVSRSREPYAVFASVSEAAPWVAARSSARTRWDPEEVLRALRLLGVMETSEGVSSLLG